MKDILSHTLYDLIINPENFADWEYLLIKPKIRPQGIFKQT